MQQLGESNFLEGERNVLIPFGSLQHKRPVAPSQLLRVMAGSLLFNYLRQQRGS